MKSKRRQKTKYVLMLPDGSLVAIPKSAVLGFRKQRIRDAFEFLGDLNHQTVGSEGAHLVFSVRQLKKIQNSWLARGIIR